MLKIYREYILYMPYIVLSREDEGVRRGIPIVYINGFDMK